MSSSKETKKSNKEQFDVITRKITIYPDYEDDPDMKNECWSYIRYLQKNVWRAKNKATQILFGTDYMKDIVLTTEKDQEKRISEYTSAIDKAEKAYNKHKESKPKSDSKEDIDKYKDTTEKLQHKLNIAKQKLRIANDGFATKELEKHIPYKADNLVYTMLKVDYPKLNSYVQVAIAGTVIKKYRDKHLKREIRSGRAIHAQYKKTNPVPFHNEGLRNLKPTEDGNTFRMELLGYKFKVALGRDRSNNREILDRIYKGIYKHGDSAFRIKDGNIELLLSVKMPKKKHNIYNKAKIVGMDLGMSMPLVAAVNNGYESSSFGDVYQLTKHRTQIQKRRKSLHKNLKNTKGGKGRGKKLQALDRLSNSERNYARTFNHTIAKNAVEWVKSIGAGTIHLEDLSGFGKGDKDKEYALRNWSYYEMQHLIEEKATREGIDVKYVNASYTSQICSCCGHYEKGQRIDQKTFLCKNPDCSHKDKDGNNKEQWADRNAAKNIALGNFILREEVIEMEKEELKKSNRKEEVTEEVL